MATSGKKGETVEVKVTDEPATAAKPGAAKAGAQRPATPAVRWDDSKMGSHYANVCNVAITREEFALVFGTNQTWNNTQKEIVIDLNTRIMMNPYAAKRLAMLLANYLREYENRFGELKIDAARGEAAGNA
ncbi:MAG TPA: DUF3467 domain-containing protein [Gammaproteobacteria bacterium]